MVENFVQHVFIVGSKGIPGAYGGYETFVDNLTRCHQDNRQIHYHVACRKNGVGVANKSGLRLLSKNCFSYHNADCFEVRVPECLGAAGAVYYDVKALKYCVAYCQKFQIKKPIIYILACRIGPFVWRYVKKVHKLGGKVFVNPDGHEWMRSKWSRPIRAYWKLSERLMVKYADLLVCDSKNIERYIQKDYARYNPKTTFIAYGADINPSKLSDDDSKFQGWMQSKGLSPKEYYLVVGRFVPENNFETMVREFMLSKTTKNFALITNVNEKFLNELKKKTGFHTDPRIKFVGTVYDLELLKKIREQAYGYFHGHSVGGTNPSLLEALASTDLNLLLDVGFNREVAEDSALYWNKTSGNLAEVIEFADSLTEDEIKVLASSSTERIAKAYGWDKIAGEYESVWGEFCE